jgi:hypothetical protein
MHHISASVLVLLSGIVQFQLDTSVTGQYQRDTSSSLIGKIKNSFWIIWISFFFWGGHEFRKIAAKKLAKCLGEKTQFFKARLQYLVF